MTETMNKGYNTNRTTLSAMKRLGKCRAEFRGDTYNAPFSGKPCLWFYWIYRQDGEPVESHIYGGSTDSLLTVSTPSGTFDLPPRYLRTYLAPSFCGKAEVEGKEAFVTEFCIEAERSYYIRVERQTCWLPPLLRIIPRRRSILLLAVSDLPFNKWRRPIKPLPVF